MREILFRGKRINNGEWMCGSLLKVTYDGNTYNLIFADNFLFVFGEATAMEHACVDPETVGQFTGLTDKNGKKIFEGDILQYSIEEDQAVFVGAVKFGEFNPDGGELLNTNIGFHVEFADQEGKRTYMRKDIGFWVKFRQVEVIGNIHDNPELLEVQ